MTNIPTKPKVRPGASATNGFAFVIVFAATALIMAGLVGFFITLGYQIYQWLKVGEWVELPLKFLLTWIEIDTSVISSIKWQGIKKIIFWLLEMPLSVMSIVLGVTPAWALIIIFKQK